MNLSRLLALVVLSSVLGFAQSSSTGALIGNVTDPSGAMIPMLLSSWSVRTLTPSRPSNRMLLGNSRSSIFAQECTSWL